MRALRSLAPALAAAVLAACAACAGLPVDAPPRGAGNAAEAARTSARENSPPNPGSAASSTAATPSASAVPSASAAASTSTFPPTSATAPASARSSATATPALSPSSPSSPASDTTFIAPEAASGYVEKSGVVAQRFMVAAANPLATDVGIQILQDGGSAVDAVIAVQMVLTLVEPQSSGIGGGAFLMHFDGKKVSAFDGRETAPAAATDSLLQQADGTPLDYVSAVVGGRSVGAPGLLRMLEMAHRQHGRLPWARLFEPAIQLAQRGFVVSPRLASLIRSDRHLARDPASAAYFYDRNGRPWAAGHLLRNPALAEVLREIAVGGADAFHTGRTARDIEAKVKSHPTNPGLLTAIDIAGYQAKVREPVCAPYRIYVVCGMPPPSSGGISIAQLLGILEHHDLPRHRPVDGLPTAQAIHLFSEAGRLAYADRARYIADTDFVPLPGNSVAPLIDPAYLAGRAALIGQRSMGSAQAGMPLLRSAPRGTDRSPELTSTSHISVVDPEGRAVSMTSSIEAAFGSRQMVRGFLLNNQLTDFSFVSADEDGPVANRVQGGKRPRSAMAPTFVFDKASGRLLLATGSPGGSAIINYVGKVLVGVLDWKLDVQQAISLPNFGSRNGPTELEKGRFSADFIKRLQDRGHHVREMELTSGAHAITRVDINGTPKWFGGADPRREGEVRGR